MLIVRAAIMYSNGEIVEGHDYGHITSIATKLSLMGDRLFGFVTSSGEFVYPTHAADIAFEAGQTSEHLEELTPEDLWPEYAGE